MPASDPSFNLIFFLRPLENHEDWPLPSPLSFLLITKKKFYFEVSYLFCLVFYFLYFIFSQINSFYFKIKYFSQKIILKIYFKNSLESSGSKSFFILKNNMQPYFVRFASFSVSNKEFGFEQKHESKLVVPNNGIILG